MYPPIKFEKQLVIYGAGHYPSATAATFLTKISGRLTLSQEASGFHLEGVNIIGDIYFDANESVNDVTIKRCHFSFLSVQGDGTTPAENNTFLENVIYNMHTFAIDNLSNSMFFNNIIENRVGNARNLIFLNNLFLYSSGSYSTITYANNCMFKNNTFLYESSQISTGAGASTWSNNMFCTNTTTPTLGTDPVLVNNYFVTRADVLVNQTDGTFDYTHDYHLQAGMGLPTYPGDGGYETGIYGGFYPWKDASIPVNPHISSKTISPTSDTNGNIQVDINVHAQDR